MDKNLRLGRLADVPWLAKGLALLGGIIFSIQLWTYAHTQSSVLDEGLYLYKGYQYAIGSYVPFQDYGFWTNHMPLSFLIPGYIQKWFGPGLREGRYFAIIISILMLAGVWVVARRLGGKWWATTSVWILVINPVVAKMYSVGVSQGIVACMLVWTLVLTLGEDRPRWQIWLGSALAGVILLTRVNLTPLLPLLLIYILWQHGWQVGVQAFVAGVIPLLIFHGLYWPNILKLWAYWLPETLMPPLAPWRPPPDTLPSWSSPNELNDQILSFIIGIRHHFLVMVGVFTSWILWPKKEKWGSQNRFRMAIFLSILYAVLLLLHMWVTLAGTQCVYCLNGYIAFFMPVGIFIIILVIPLSKDSLTTRRSLIIFGLVLIISIGLGYGISGDVGRELFSRKFIKDLLFTKVYWVRSLGEQLVKLKLWILIANKLRLPINSEGYTKIFILMQRVLPTLAGLTIGLLILVISLLTQLVLTLRKSLPEYKVGYTTLVIFLGMGVLLSPTDVLGNGVYEHDCKGNILNLYEDAGQHLAGIIPSGSIIYWQAYSPVSLLYLPDIEIFPSQLNIGYSFRLGGKAAEFEKYGFWNQELADQWIMKADYVLVEDRFQSEWLLDIVRSDSFNELEPTPLTNLCREGSFIHIFERVP